MDSVNIIRVVAAVILVLVIVVMIGVLRRTGPQAASASATLRSDIQWGIVRGLFTYMLHMIPISFLVGIAYAILTAR